jgi:regulator of replication initiation timing
MTAPIFNRLNALTGDVADSPVLGILSTANDLHDAVEQGRLAQADADDAAETIGTLLEENTSLRCRVDELEDELADLRTLNRTLVNDLARARQERDNLRASVTVGVR